MGRKGVSKRKPKKTFSDDKISHGFSNAPSGESSSPVQALVNAKDSPLRKAGNKPSTGSNTKNRKGR